MLTAVRASRSSQRRYVAEGMDEEEFRSSREELAQLEQDYVEMEADTVEIAPEGAYEKREY